MQRLPPALALVVPNLFAAQYPDLQPTRYTWLTLKATLRRCRNRGKPLTAELDASAVFSFAMGACGLVTSAFAANRAILGRAITAGRGLQWRR